MSDQPKPTDRRRFHRRPTWFVVVLVLIVGGGVSAFLAGNRVACAQKVELAEVPVQVSLTKVVTASQRRTILRAMEQRVLSGVHVSTTGSLDGLLPPHGVQQLRDRLNGVPGVSSIDVGNQVTVIRHHHCT